MRKIASVAALSLGLLLSFGGPAFADPPLHVAGTGDVFTCDDSDYTVTGGELLVREEVRTDSSGATHVVFHLVAKNLEAVDTTGTSHRIVGVATDTVHYGEQGLISGEQFTIRMRILSSGGGIAGFAHLSVHVHPDGGFRVSQSGSCTPPDTV